MAYFWQHIPEHLNPVAFLAGPVQISWYGIMYAVAFTIVYYLVRYRIRTEKLSVSFETVQDFFPWAILGMLLGARLGDVFIYDWSYFSSRPLNIFLPFDAYDHWQYIGIYGMSYFGGLIGLVITFYFFCRIKRISLLEFSDLFAPGIPLAFTFGRLGNFINGELWGRATTKFWGMYFPADFTGELRHPSQIYEALLEGLLLFFILWPLRKKRFQSGYLTAFYLTGYSAARFTTEFFRQPDNDWFIGPLTIGQIFSLLLLLGAGVILVLKYHGKRK
ncbi:MAG: prolipoprotein diacylglyceryl transferase [Parcubacteria group bacterium]|jgi:phosphatidylglycerol:prolipoprotein diacylglycerol transferase